MNTQRHDQPFQLAGLICLALILLPANLYAQNTGSLTGKVTEASSGRVIEAATISIQNTALQHTSNNSGSFDIIGIPASTYTVIVSAPGFATQIIQGIDIIPDASITLAVNLNSDLSADSETLTYRPPPLKKGVIGKQNVFRLEALRNTPLRGPTEFTRTQAGIVSFDGFNDLHIRGGRSNEVDYYLDGIKLEGDTHLLIPQIAIGQLQVQTGHMDARYGDAMSGIVNITSKSGSNTLFGSAEVLTSERLDPYGYNVLSGTAGGPITGNKLRFFLAGEYITQDDSSPSAMGQLRISPSTLDDLRAAPMGFRATDRAGNQIVLPIPAALADGATLLVDDNGQQILTDDQLVFSDGTVIQANDIDPTSFSANPVFRTNFLSEEDFSIEPAQIGRQQSTNTLMGILSWQPFRSATLRLSGNFHRTSRDQGGPTYNRQVIFSPEIIRQNDRSSALASVSWTQNFSRRSLFHINADIWKTSQSVYDPRFGKSTDDLLEYGNIDSPVYDVLRGYKNLAYTQEIRIDDHGTSDPSDDTAFPVQIPTYLNTYSDGAGPTLNDNVISSLVQIPGGRFNSFEQSEHSRMRLSGYFQTQQDNHHIEIGGSFEKHTQRFWQINAPLLARLQRDAAENGDGDNSPTGYPSFDAIPLNILNTAVGVYYGYDLRGQQKVDGEDFDQFISQDIEKPLDAYNLKPHEPIKYSAYIQDKIAWNDVVLHLGLRAEGFDNNTRVLRDPFLRRSVCLAGDLNTVKNGVNCGSGEVPITIEDNYTVFYSGETVIGYRDRLGNLYSAGGLPADPIPIILSGQPRQTSNIISEDLFTDYKPYLRLLPRIGINLLMNEDAILFASYNVVSQSPPTNNFATLEQFERTGTLNNTGLIPERTRKIELGLHNRIGDHLTATISSFFYKSKNLVSLRTIANAHPSSYFGVNNKGTSTRKGLEIGLDVKPTQGLGGHFNYTYSFAEGTLLGSHTALIDHFNKLTTNHPFPLDFDQRHKINLAANYLLGARAGPQVLGIHPFEHLNIALLVQAGSGFPYTASTFPLALSGPNRVYQTKGNYNSTRMPASSRVDLQINRTFHLLSGRSSATFFLWVQNLFDNRNINQVWPYTGSPDFDGFLSSQAGARFLDSSSPISESLYQHRSRIPNWVGIPRLVRLGLRLDF